MKIIVGILLILLAWFGNQYFFRNNGSALAHPIFLRPLAVFIGIIGVGFIISALQKDKKTDQQPLAKAIEKLKRNTDKVELDFDRCVFKSGSYSHEVPDNDSGARLLATHGLSGLADAPTVNEDVIQSYLVYNYPGKAGAKKYISQNFPFDEKALEFYVLNRNISLYIDRADPEKYLFELVR